MNAFRSKPVQNLLLAALPEEEFTQLEPALTWVRLVPNQVLVDKGEVAEHAYFITSGLISARDVTPSGSFIQVAMVGREGLVSGEALLAGNPASPMSHIVQQPSVAVRVPVPELKRLLPLCPRLEFACMDAVKSLIGQVVETAGANARCTVAERFIRLLLIMHDRVDGEELCITHEMSAAMLGVRRSGVTLVASGLQDSGLIQVGRGRITMLDRAGLERQLTQGTGMPPTRARYDAAPAGSAARQNAKLFA